MNQDPNLLVGFGTSDDAGVYKLNDQTAIIMTADFITPPVDDPFVFGQIAAANAISDVYAMGGTPLACLNLIAFPSGKLPQETLHQIIAGGLSKITEAGAVLAGGHSIDDDEPKYGLSVTGTAHPDRIWTNTGARPGDALVLTKPVGSGVLFNANLKNWVSAKAMQSCIDVLTTLNRQPAEIMQAFDIHAATDVTGFGLAGHGLEMVGDTAITIEFQLETLPVMDEALEMYKKGMTTGVNANNRQLVAAMLKMDPALPTWRQEIVFDPQTNGGLLAALPAGQSQELLGALHSAGIESAAIIGRVTERQKGAGLVIG
jgi:selenide,water dikinase